VVHQVQRASPENVEIKFIQNKLHAKFSIIDKKILMAGSTNWSDGFETNDENLFITTETNFVNNANESFKILKNSDR